MTEGKVLIKNLQINYKVFGGEKPFDTHSTGSGQAAQGKTILVLHGWRSSSDRWQKTAELLALSKVEGLAENQLQVIVPDLPGFGKSEEPKEAWGIDGYVEWVKDFTDAVPVLQQDFYLLGHSFGGAVAAKFSIKYAQRVRKMFLVAGSCIRIATPSKKIAYNISRIFKLFYFFPGYELLRKFIYKFVLRKSDYPYVSGIMRAIYLKVISEDLSHRLPFIRIPTAIIWGDKDDLTPIEHANIIHKKIEGSTLTVLPGLGHALHIAAPELLVQEIAKHL